MNNRLHFSFNKKFANTVYILIALVISGMSLWSNEVFTGNTKVITYDAYGYYVYLPAIFIHSDAEEYSFVEDHFANYDISAKSYQVRNVKPDYLFFTSQDEEVANEDLSFPIYNIGLALLWLPFFLVAHMITLLLPAYPPDGMSFPYQVSVLVSSLVYMAIGFYFLKNVLQYLFGHFTAIITLILIGFATNYFYYSVNVPGLTHTYLFSLYAIVIYFIITYFREQKTRDLVILGLMCGLCILIRSSEVVAFLLVALYGISIPRLLSSLRYAIDFIKIRMRPFLTVFLLSCLVFLIQITYYKSATGYWFLNGYGDHYFEFLNPHLYEGFFGYRRGMFVYAPVMIFAIVGFYPLYQIANKWFLPILLFFIANSYLLFSWHIWWYGNTFGSRPVIQSYAVLALPLASFIYYIYTKRNVFLSTLLSVVFGFFIFLNLFQTWQFKHRILPLDFINKTYYWHMFLETSHTRDDYKYLDTNEKLPDKNYTSSHLWELQKPLMVNGKGSKKYKEYQDLLELRLNDTLCSQLQDNWIQTELEVSYYGNAFDKWTATKFVVDFKNDQGKNLKWKKLRIPAVMENLEHDSITFNLKVPNIKEGAHLHLFLWHTTTDSLKLHDAEVSVLQEQ